MAAALLAASTPTPARAQFAARTSGSPFGATGQAPALPLIADGYCLVRLHDQQQWVQGDPRIAAAFDGRQYLFAGVRERDIFAAAPTVYAPVLSGDCVVTFAETGRRVPGVVQFGMLYGGRTYFFADEPARARFVAQPSRFVDADLADGGKCIVSRLEARQDVAGLPETAVLTGGMRRLFAGAHQQQRYLQNPAAYEGGGAAAVSGLTDLHASSGTWRPAAAGSVPEAAPGTASQPAPSNSRQPSQSPGAQALGAQSPGAQPPGAQPPSAQSPNSHDGHQGGEIPLPSDPAMGGYCPVSIRRRGAWVRGRYEDRVTVDALEFFTAGPAERAEFMATPTAFIPAMGGDCPVSRVDLGEKVRGSIYHAWDYQGRLYLFADAERRAAFQANPAKYASADLAAAGACVVTLAEQGKTEPGLAEIAVWHNGMLYRFASEPQRAKFLATPDKYLVRPER